MVFLTSPSGDVPHVLVLMATRNGASFVGEQVASIADQQDVLPTLVVSDDDSSDATIASIRASAPPGMPLQFVQSSLPGGSAGRNFFRLMLAARVAGHDYVALADQDDRWAPDKLSRAIADLHASQAEGYSSAVLAYWPDGEERLLAQSKRQTNADYLFEGAGQGCTFVMRANFFEQLQSRLAGQQMALGSIHYHDWTLYALARAMGRSWYFDDRPSMRYRQHAGNDTGARGNLTSLRKRVGLIRSGWYGSQTRAIAQLCATVNGSAAAAMALEYLHLANAAARGNRASLALFVWRNGRRRLLDRLALVVAALFGYLDGGDSMNGVSR